jgi:hypothetical protein
MRLPTADPTPNPFAKIEEPEALRMIHYAIEQGVNYLDTAYLYHGGQSELVVGKALKEGGYRHKVRLATKLPVMMIKEEGEFERILNEQLGKLQTDYIDYYLLHGLSRKTWQDVVLKFDFLSKSEAAIRDGRIRYLGFSFHDDYEAFAEIVNGYDRFAFCQIQYNYMDTENQAGTKGLKLAASKGLAVVIMEPLLGGKLANPPQPIRDFIESCEPRRSPADWALQWLWDQPEVSVVLSGMSNMTQVQQNLASAEVSRVNSLQTADHKVIEQLQQKYRERTVIPCTKCQYCMPCPNGVAIPQVFDLYNLAMIHEEPRHSRMAYGYFVPEPARANHCQSCQECEEKCPQKIKVSEWMPKVHELLATPAAPPA